jgi:predicted acylesterase/phospholipase RssA
MGAVVGAIYASGVSGSEIKERIRRHLILREDSWNDVFEKRVDLLKWFTAFTPLSFSEARLKITKKGRYEDSTFAHRHSE